MLLAACTAAMLSGCIQGGTDGATTAEADRLPRLQADAGEDRLVGQGQTAELTVTIRGGKAPYHVRWSQDSGPTTTISASGATGTTGPLLELGSLVFRVVVADATGQHDTDFLAIEVVPAGSETEQIVITGPTVIDTDQGITLSVAGGGNASSLMYDWQVLSGDAQLTNANTAMPTLTGGEAGDVRLRVEVTDPSSGSVRSAETTVHVALRVSVDGPDIAVAGMPEALTTTVNADPSRVMFDWSVEAGMGDIDDATAQSVVVTTSLAETVRLRLTARLASGAQSEEATADVRLVSIEDTTPEALIQTSAGDIRLELFYDDAPMTVFNFLRYADDDFFHDVVFHRVIAGFVIQAGGFVLNGEELEGKPPTYDPVMSEANNGHSNTVGTVAMALRGNDANSATSQFFINLGDNSFLDEATASQPAFTVFGHVTEGMDVVENIAAVPTGMRSGQSDVPLEPVTISAVTRGR
ncbi:MAG TPA: peptidylprolyl isomerase [Lysobacter sp.]|nr:peptidylprolyl isomerase [Lysobacter sp.]